MRNDKSVNTHSIDIKVKVSPKEHAKIAERLDEGDSQEQVAADYGVTDRQIHNIATTKCRF